MISHIKIIGALLYATRESLRNNKQFLDGLNVYKYAPTLFKDDKFSLWHLPGTPEEISRNLVQMGQSVYGCKDKFPSVMNFQPIEQNYAGQEIMFTYNLAFVSPTFSEWTTEEREHYLFEPVLRPIVNEFFKQIEKSMYFKLPYGFIPHKRYEVYTTGNKADEQIKGRYGDYMDAVELHSLNLTLRNNLCQKDFDKIEQENKQII